MSEPTMETPARRLDRVERENPLLKRAGVVALAGIAAVMLMGQVFPPGASPEVIYTHGLKSYVDGNFDEAMKSFKEYLTKFPNTTYAPDAQYWLAETYYAERKDQEAIREFDVFLSKYPNHKRTGHALLKKGFALLNLGQQKEGKTALEKVVQDYPGTKEAGSASRTLTALTGKPTIDPKILSHCKRISGDSYSLLEACIRQEEEAKRRLGY